MSVSVFWLVKIVLLFAACALFLYIGWRIGGTKK